MHHCMKSRHALRQDLPVMTSINSEKTLVNFLHPSDVDIIVFVVV